MNPVLFQSSLFLGLLHVIAVVHFYPGIWIALVYLGGVITSLLNHGLTSKVAKWTDRSWMTMGVITDILFILSIPLVAIRVKGIALVVAYVSLYFIAKYLVSKSKDKQKGNLPHILTHILATLTHIWLLFQGSLVFGGVF
jgi:hypothetical protein